MKLFNVLVLILFLSISFSCSGNSDPVSNHSEEPDVELDYTTTEEFDFTVSGYSDFNLSGFHVLVQEQSIKNHPSLTNSVLRAIERDLEKSFSFNLNEAVINKLKGIPIFVDYHTTDGAAQYHPSESWLTQNGYLAKKAESVEIPNMNNFLDWRRQNQPFLLFHELSHAFHHREYNFTHSTITEAFDNAVSSGLYKDVEYHNGTNNYEVIESAYALNNEKEYFAELSEAYFGRNDYYPFVVDELETYDPMGYEMVKSVWKIE